MEKRTLGMALAAVAMLWIAMPALACDKTSLTQISLLGKPNDPCAKATVNLTVKHTIYWCTGPDFQCHDKEIEFTFSSAGTKDKKKLAEELAAHIKTCLGKTFPGKVEAVDNVVQITKTNSCSGTGDPCTDDKPCKQPKNAGKNDFQTEQTTSKP